jgi:2,4-dienoyl-CoA reductase-like NADH-dependent reductase (Old Yellow Enzyme family)
VPHVKIPLVPLYQVPFAERIKKETGILTGAVGLITTPAEAQSIVSEGKADLVFMARELLRNPYFPLQASAELDSNIPWPVQYERAKKKKG